MPKQTKSDLLEIPGIGQTFAKDFARIKVLSQADLVHAKAEALFAKLEKANAKVNHKTSQNYLYVLRMAIYYAEGGRDTSKLKWHYWKNPETPKP
ncbi:hypothetical protein LPTSP4_18240 [Leptospira ryugenii]|uniref:Pathogenicity locus n=1 Tax=Leptospira ryugenii TaxID=1917863 RepID=A0A2P2E097_9LEPT|nr:helix-hairpin-helix domain-containing protein [Leptospira ryugenii]GBF50299.1 hypothetical protein LPTSP4_18240 [Leptospira ryugenii]